MMTTMPAITEPIRQTPVVADVDLIVIGGCTGVFAALRAASHGVRVALIRNHECLWWHGDQRSRPRMAQHLEYRWH